MSRALGLMSAGWLGLVLLLTLTPSETSEPIKGLCLVCGTYGVSDLVVNVAMLLPLGCLVALRWPGWRTLVALLCLPVAIETAQLVIPGRHPTPSDAVFNILGLGIGFQLGRLVPRLEARRPGFTIWAWTAGMALVVLTFGALRMPAFSNADYFVSWNPSLRVIDPYPGAVEQTAIGPLSLVPGRAIAARPVVDALERGDPLHIRFRAVPEAGTPDILGIAGVWDRDQREVILLGVRGGTLLVRGWNRGQEWRVRSWSPATGLTAGPSQAQSLTASIWMTEHSYYCVRIEARESCETRPSVSSWWTGLFVAPSESWVQRVNWAVLILTGLPLGLLSGAPWVRISAGALLVTSFHLVPLFYPVAGLIGREWALLAGGGMIGALVRHTARHVASAQRRR